jgi:ComF family protein
MRTDRQRPAGPGGRCRDRLLDLLWPRHCLACGGPVGAGIHAFLCPACRAHIDFIDPPFCPLCGNPLQGMVGAARPCPKCHDLKPVFTGGRALFLHRDCGARLVLDLKYHDARYWLRDLRPMLRRRAEWADWFAQAVLVPVPLHPRKQRARGYNQSEELAAAIIRTFPSARIAHLLRRVADTPTQTRMGAVARRTNVKNAFALAPKAVLDPALSFMLVDDVYTTGSTLNACAGVLRAGGAENIRIFTLAHG